MTSKLTGPQKRVLVFAATHAGIARTRQFSITVLRNLEAAGMMTSLRMFGEYVLTEAGAAAIGYGDSWPLIHALICEYKLDSHHIRPCGKVVTFGWHYDHEPKLEPEYYRDTLEREVDRIDEHLQLAIELTRAELRAGLV